MAARQHGTDATVDAPAGDEHYAHAPPLPSLLVRAFTGYQDGWWHAIALDYTIIGRGTSRDAAVENMIELLGDYLELCLRDGVTPTGAAIARRTSSTSPGSGGTGTG